MNLDWRPLKVVVLESDDWGMCAWVPDEQAFRILADGPAWRHPAGQIYGRSTLEHAADVARLVGVLKEYQGRDGLPPVWQANTVMGTPDFARLRAPLFECQTLPLLLYPEFPSRWQRPGLWEQVQGALEAGLWWPEFHGVMHLPQGAWLKALRRGATDARRAHEHQCFVCEAVEASAEYDAAEPAELRTRSLSIGAEHFLARFGRSPASLCAPDYRWDQRLESDAEALGVTIIQGEAEQAGRPFPRLRRALRLYRWPDVRGRRFYLPPRIAFEPRGQRDPATRLGAEAAHRSVRRAWSRGQPAVVSSHRVNYAHLDADWTESGRAALRELLGRLAGDGALFLTDAEVRSLLERGWSLRSLGERGALLRHYGPPRERLRFPAPAGAAGVSVRDAPGTAAPRLTMEGREVVAELDPGEYRLEWRST